MKIKALLTIAAASLLFVIACKETETNDPVPVNNSPASAKVNGNLVTYTAPATPADTLDEPLSTTEGTAFWDMTDDTISIICAKEIGADSYYIIMQAVMPTARIGSYSLNWNYLDLLKYIDNDESTSFPVNCFYGKFEDIDNVLDQPASEILTYTGTGNLSVTSFTNNQMSGTFNFTSDLGTTRKYTITEGKFTNINRAIFF
jgi:hypothetical protein